MMFGKVIDLLKQGKKVRRRLVHTKGEFFRLHAGVIVKYDPDEDYYYVPHFWSQDLFAEDWEVVE